MKTIINQNQKGFLFKNGKFIKVLDSGRYYTFGDKKIEVVPLSAIIQSAFCSPEQLRQNEKFRELTETVEVGANEKAYHFCDDKFVSPLFSGKYDYWKDGHTHKFIKINLTNPEIDEIETVDFSKISPHYHYIEVNVREYEKGLVYFDNKFVKILEPGTYRYWRTNVDVRVQIVDTRLLQMNITGQEILTKDKVAIRTSLMCTYRITDYVKAYNEIEDFREQIHITAQLAMRDYVGKCNIDEILESKEQMGEYILERLKAKGGEFFVEFSDAGVKDIILPGEIRDIMNTVLIAEKRAQANVITRREEVASTRSLLNTAKLMDENKTLYKLKELEYIERICENVGNITVNGSQDLLTQLTTILKKE